MRKESKIRLSKLLEKFSLVERVAPELPKIKERLRDVELAQYDFKGLYRELVMRDEMNTLLVQFKSETATYIDNAMKQWEFEYRKGHEDILKKYEEIRLHAKEILPRGQFREYMTRQHELTDTVKRVESVLMDGFKHEARTVLQGKLGLD